MNQDGKTKETGRKPRAFSDLSKLQTISETADEVAVSPAAEPRPHRKRTPLAKIFFLAAGLLLSIALGLAVDGLIRELLERNPWLGRAGLAIAGIAVLAFLLLILREVRGIWRLRKIESIRSDGDAAFAANDSRKASQVLRALDRLYSGRPDTARGRRLMAAHAGEIIDGTDLLKLAERDLLKPLDTEARRLVRDTARRVSVVTAVSPRALLDLIYVLFENLRMIRRMADLYGGRPGLVGMWNLSGKVVTHLAATGAIAIGEGVVQQVIGHGLAARLSARLGEGIVNGMLTARIGLAAMEICRPISFRGEKRPAVTAFLTDLARLAEEEKEKQGRSDGPRQ